MNCDLRALHVADLADHDDIGVLPHDRPQPRGEGQSGSGIHLNVAHAGELILHGIFDGENSFFRRIQQRQGADERRRLSTPGRTGNKDDAVRLTDQALISPAGPGLEAELFQREQSARLIQQPQDEAFAMEGRQRGDTKVNAPVVQRQLEGAILWEAAFCDIETREDLDPRRQCRLDGLRQSHHLLHRAVDPVADAEVFLLWFDMNVAGSILECLREDEIDQPDDRGIVDPLRLFGRRRRGSLLLLDVAEHCLGCRSHAIRPPDTRFDFRFDCHHRFDRPAGGNADVIDRIDIERVGHRDDQVVAVQHQRQHPALAG